MLDDDIEYIGTRLAQRTVITPSFVASPQIVTGITLHVERAGEEPPYDLTFRRPTASVVHIGRRPATEAERSQGESQRAMFRCAVVSRKHAKIAFSDSGHVYLIDLNSHHGTHIRKPGETVSRILKPETPTELADGDVLTFGKSVGRNNEIVRPVVARVELMHSPRPDSVFKPTTPIKPGTVFDLTKSPPPRSSSGRYGVYVPASPSSDDISSAMSHDSDIEEIPASGPNALPLQPRGARSAESESHLGRAFEALKRLLPPVHIPGAPASSPSEHSGRSSPSYRPASPSPFDSPPRLSPVYSPLWAPSPHHFTPTEDRSRSPYPYIHQYWDNFHPSVEHGSYSNSPAEEHDASPSAAAPESANRSSYDASEHHSEARSRSTSPMDLASPSPSLPPGLSLNEEQPIAEPSIVGAWPGSRSSSPPPPVVTPPFSASIAAVPCETSSVAGPCSLVIQKAMSLDSICVSEPPAQPIPSAAESVTPIAEPEVKEAQAAEKKVDEISSLQRSLAKLQGEVGKLQTHRRKYKARFNTNVHLISDKLVDLDERVTDVNAQYTMLLERVDNATDIDIPDLQAQVEHLREQIDALPAAPGDSSAEPLLYQHRDVKENIETLRELVVEMRTLRETTQQHMSAELAAVREARDAALAAIAAHVEAQPSLKRKRGDGEDAGVDAESGAEDGAGVSDAADVEMAAATTTFTAIPCVGAPPPPRPRKRARRIAAVAVQTATAVTVGAIATWSALAFS